MCLAGDNHRQLFTFTLSNYTGCNTNSVSECEHCVCVYHNGTKGMANQYIKPKA